MPLQAGRGPARSVGEAMAAALTGPAGFYRRHSPYAHFATSASAGPEFAVALRRLVEDVDRALGRPDPFDVLDVGAADGRLLAAVGSGAPARWRLRSADLDDGHPAGLTGVLLACEWLDTVPVEVVRQTADGPRRLLADGTLGGPPTPAENGWLDRWWPDRGIGDRAELGIGRDAAWAGLLAGLTRGLALAVDYGHTAAGRPAGGTLAGYRAGRVVPVAWDGSADVTAHVALDAVAAAAPAGTPTVLVRQRDALRALGVPSRPAPGDGLAGIAAAARGARLIDPDGPGGHGWLAQAVRTPLPPVLTGLPVFGMSPPRRPGGP